MKKIINFFRGIPILSWLGKLFAIGLIVFLALSDITAMIRLFSDLQYDTDQQKIFALTLGCFLEGLPFFFGIALAKCFDKTQYIPAEKAIAKVGAIVSAIAILAAFALAVGLKLLWIELNGGYEAFLAGTYGGINDNERFVGDLFMVFMPILTSILAFVASWLTFQNSAMKGLKKDVSQLWVKMNRAEHKFRVAQLKNVAERVSLWSSLADPDTEPMPREFEVFRQQCFRKIRLKLHTNCCETFGPQLERYTSEVEARLAEMILIASQHSTLPQTISRIPLNAMTKAFDDQVSEDAEAWSCSRCGGVMVQDLERELDNMVVVAQFENATKPDNWKRRKK